MKYTVEALRSVGAEDTYGNMPYSIKFAEEGETAFWKTKQRVSVGQEVEGEVIEAVGKSGKPYKKFVFGDPEKRAQFDNKPSGGNRSSGMSDEKSAEIKFLALLKVASSVYSGSGEPAKTVYNYANELLSLMDGEDEKDVTPTGDDIVAGEAVDLSDIPF